MFLKLTYPDLKGYFYINSSNITVYGYDLISGDENGSTTLIKEHKTSAGAIQCKESVEKITELLESQSIKTIKLTAKLDNTPLYIVISHIIMITNDYGISIHDNDKFWDVVETQEEIMKLIDDALEGKKFH